VSDLFDDEFDRRLWRLRHDNHWSIRRIARWLNLSTGTVSSRLNQLQLQQQGYRYSPRPNPKRRKFRPISLSGLFNV
jgi:IS30 family transposase